MADGGNFFDQGARRFQLVQFANIQMNRSPAYLVRDILPREGLVVVWGPPKCGKSFWALDLVLHVAMDRSYRVHRVTKGHVVYVACEGERGLNSRIAAWRAYHSDAPANTPFWLLTTRLDLAAEHKQLADDVAAQMAAPAVIVIDTLNRSLNGSESRDEDMADYIKDADYLREWFNCLVVIIHHCGIDGTRPRGHTSLLGAADAQIAVKNQGGTVIATVEFMKDGGAGAVVASTLKVIDLGQDHNGEPTTSCVIEPADAPAQKEKRLTGQAGRALEILVNLVAKDGELLPRTDGFPSDTTIRGVRRTECDRRGLSSSPDDSSRRRTFNRAYKDLIDTHAVAVLDDWAWTVRRSGPADVGTQDIS